MALYKQSLADVDNTTLNALAENSQYTKYVTEVAGFPTPFPLDLYECRAFIQYRAIQKHETLNTMKSFSSAFSLYIRNHQP